MARLFITGDTHGENDNKEIVRWDKLMRGELTKKDVLIIAGDFGFIWADEGMDPAEEYWMEWFHEREWTTCFVDGNHENHDRLDALPIVDKFNGKVGRVNDSVFHLRRGEIYRISGKDVLTIGGAISIDKHLRTDGISWWEQEEINQEEKQRALFNIKRFGYKVDIVVTHACPTSLVFATCGMSTKKCATSKFLEQIAGQLEYNEWYFGHMHVDKKLGKFRALFNDIVEITT